MKEIWKAIEGYEGLYEVSNTGKVKSLEKQRSRTQPHIITKEKLLKPSYNGWGYKHIVLTKDSLHKAITVHRLVATAFISNPENKRCINHMDSNRINNNVENLEWVTHQENIDHAVLNNRMDWTKAARGNNSGKHKLTEDMVIQIRNKYKDVIKWPCKEIAIEYNVSYATIWLLERGKNWKWLL